MMERKQNVDLWNDNRGNRGLFRDALAHYGLKSVENPSQPEFELTEPMRNSVIRLGMALQHVEDFYANYNKSRNGNEVPRSTTSTDAGGLVASGANPEMTDSADFYRAEVAKAYSQQDFDIAA